VPKTVTFEIRGLKELEAKLEDLPKKVANKVLRTSLKKAAERVRAAMSQHAPEDSGFLSEHFGVRTKILRALIVGMAYIGPEGKMDYPLAMGGYKERTTKKGKVRRIGRIAVASVARFLEFGTSKMSAKPFMTQAFEQAKQAALQDLIDGIKQGIAETTKK